MAQFEPKPKSQPNKVKKQVRKINKHTTLNILGSILDSQLMKLNQAFQESIGGGAR